MGGLTLHKLNDLEKGKGGMMRIRGTKHNTTGLCHVRVRNGMIDKQGHVDPPPRPVSPGTKENAQHREESLAEEWKHSKK